MHRTSLVARALVVVATASLVVGGAGLARANQPWQVEMTDPMESSITFETQGSGTQWHLAVVAQGGLFYKGMDVKCSDVMSNTDVNNRFVQTPTWLGDPETANAYAIRSTAKVAMKNQVVLIDQLSTYDPSVATIAQYQATRKLRLLVLMDKQNIDNLLAKIQAAIDKKLQTGIGQYIADGAWRADPMDDQDQPTIDDMLYELSKDRSAIDGYIRQNASSIPLGMTQAEITFMLGNLKQKNWQDDQAQRRVAKRNRVEALKIVDDLIAMQREKFVVRFTTGDKMTWAQQRAVLGQYRVAQRGLANRANFDNGTYDVVYPNSNWPKTTIGPDAEDLNRISLMNRDLELMDIVKKYVNVDGYWAPEVPSLWHRNQEFHSEAALVYPAAAVDFTGRCMNPLQVQAPEEVEED